MREAKLTTERDKQMEGGKKRSLIVCYYEEIN